MNKSMIKDSLILFAITLIAGFLLGGVYAVTKNPIANTQEQKKQDAYKEVFADAESFTEDEFDLEQAQNYLNDANLSKEQIDEVVYADDASGNHLGYVITVTSNEAYGGSLQIAVGIKNDGTVNGISFLSLSETTGLGMEAKKSEFYSQFANKKVGLFTYTKQGATSDDQIDALSGATITTNAVTNAVNAAITYANELMLEQDGGEQGE